ncbi:MAG: haloacid dehalogenase superfamily enzyme subfamily [Candidatus Saccharibacteria bacterium]|nr:haloacid dehalogenase superfamily enzyme subfamily [Candidatus Saccharibacteria bacterium]
MIKEAMIEAIAFDWDGVIGDSARVQVQAEKNAATTMAEALGVELDIDVIDWEKRFPGWGRVKIAAELFDVDPKDEIAENYREQVVGETVKIIDKDTLTPVIGVKDFLDYTKFRVGNLAVATSSNRLILDPSIELFNMGDYFRETVAHRECKDDKPKPGQYLEVARRLNIEPRNLLVIEDSPSGIESGRYAGALVLAVAVASTKSAEYLRTKTDAHMVASDYEHARYLLQPHMK